MSHVVELQAPGVTTTFPLPCSAAISCFLLRRRNQNIHNIAPPIAIMPNDVATPMPAAAPLLSPLLPLLLLDWASPVTDAVGAVSDAAPGLDVDSEVVTIAPSPVDVAVFCMTIPYAIIVPGARRLLGEPAFSPPFNVPSIVVKLVSMSTLYTLMQPRVGPQG